MATSQRIKNNEPVRLKIVCPVEQGIFYQFGNWYVLSSFADLPTGTYVAGDQLPLSSSAMLDVFILHDKDNQPVGLAFKSAFQVINHGGYLAAFLNSKRRKAKLVDVLLRSDDYGVIIYNYPNVGTMVVSILISPEVQAILEEQ